MNKGQTDRQTDLKSVTSYLVTNKESFPIITVPYEVSQSEREFQG